ncbi:MAG TPA: protein kinase [Thermoanaerobaculia bacterium]|nr:protein kinase [Thermoanaerobaculia bacterium]
MVGKQLGAYEIVGRIGAGGMGEVFRARDPRVGRDVAIKILPSSFAADRDRLARFEQEARAAAALNHPNLITLYELGTHDGAPFMVMELLEGSTLREVLEAGRMPVRKAVDVAIQIAHGLAAAHEKGIIHRDLKPENIFVTSDGRAKLLDFGLAKLRAPEATDMTIAKGETAPGTILGTPGYMSPEQVRGLPLDHRTDIFSFGSVLYEMLSGRRAFQSETAADTISAVLHGEPPELTESSLSFDRLVRHCLEKNPAERFQSMRDVAFDLQNVTTESVQIRARKKRSIRPIIEALLAVAAIAFAILWWRAHNTRDLPSFRRVTFGRGFIGNALFTPGGESFLYSAAWGDEPQHIYEGRFDNAERRDLGLLNAELYAISKNGEMAIGEHETLSRVPLAGGSKRPVANDMASAWWLPDGTLGGLRSSGSELLVEHPLGKVMYRTSDSIDVRPSRDGSRYAIARGDAVGVLDERWKLTMLSSGWSSLHGMAWSPDGKEIWFTAAKSGSERALWAVDMDGDVRLLARAAGALSIKDVAADGRTLVARHDRNSRVEISSATGTKDLSWLDFASLADVSRDGHKVLFTEEGEGGGERNSVYLRDVDGSPAVRLGDGSALALSNDGAWAATVLPNEPQRLILLPTGVGEPRVLPRVPIQHTIVRWLPDGKRFMVSGAEPGKPFRTWVEDLEGHIRAVTPENQWSAVLSADGRYCYSVPRRGVVTMYPIDGGPVQEIRGIPEQRLVTSASADGRYLFLATRVGSRTEPFRVERFEIATGKIEPWRELKIADPVGAQAIANIEVSGDGGVIAYTYRRFRTDLYLVEGLH